MTKEANKFNELFEPKYWVRYMKKGLALFVLYGLIFSILIQFVVLFIVGMMGVTEDRIIPIIRQGGIGALAILLTALAIQSIIGGFFVEYIDNAKGNLFRWIRR